ncbi:hypothetical protein CPCC7001_1162 [Cyanobium sp. PCC 7001]|nr:hypothetical protein CPCC7001_1162 [Cyanobium sp. PCC 7001]
MEQALAIERRIHRELSDKRIEGANNRELFQLSDSDLAALMLAME